MGTRPAIERAGAETPHLQQDAPDFYPSGPSFKSMWKVVKEGRLGNLETPPSVRKLQTALHAKAKAEPENRFYLLYNKPHLPAVLTSPYAKSKPNTTPPRV